MQQHTIGFFQRQILVIGIALCAVFPASALHCAPVTIRQAKLLPNGSAVELSERFVTAVFAGFFYAADDDLAWAIRIDSAAALSVGDRVSLSGTIGANEHYERVIAPSLLSSRPDGVYLNPTVLSNLQIVGEDFSWTETNGAGQRGAPGAPTGTANNVGLLVRTTGTVTMGKPGDSGDFPIDDGTGGKLLVVPPAGFANPGYGAVLSVTGISSMRHVVGTVRRVILPRGLEDIVVIQPAPAYRHVGEMVYVAAGAFERGVDCSQTDGSMYAFCPKADVWLDGYWIGKHEVTRGEYRQFVNAGGYQNRSYWSEEGWWWKLQYRTTKPAWWDDAYWEQTESSALIGVSPFEMDAYCKWAGVRRTSEAEWEKAARWDPVVRRSRTYPWGDTWDPEKCNWAGDSIWAPEKRNAPVGLYPTGASYYGCLDMSGNLFEWCRGYATQEYYKKPQLLGWINPEGDERPEYDSYGWQAYRGGSWYASESFQRGIFRHVQYPYLWNADIGFRVAR